jgi:hypothetical protein
LHNGRSARARQCMLAGDEDRLEPACRVETPATSKGT